eukprot:12935772-Alexandrium_andersonii.AAC.1
MRNRKQQPRALGTMDIQDRRLPLSVKHRRPDRSASSLACRARRSSNCRPMAGGTRRCRPSPWRSGPPPRECVNGTCALHQGRREH